MEHQGINRVCTAGVGGLEGGRELKETCCLVLHGLCLIPYMPLLFKKYGDFTRKKKKILYVPFVLGSSFHT